MIIKVQVPIPEWKPDFQNDPDAYLLSLSGASEDVRNAALALQDNKTDNHLGHFVLERKDEALHNLYFGLLEQLDTGTLIQVLSIKNKAEKTFGEMLIETENERLAARYFCLLNQLALKGIDPVSQEKIQLLRSDALPKQPDKLRSAIAASDSAILKSLKEAVLLYIKTSGQDSNSKLILLREALNPATGLGRFFHLQRGSIPCSTKSGVLQKIEQALNDLQKPETRVSGVASTLYPSHLKMRNDSTAMAARYDDLIEQKPQFSRH